MLLLIIFAFLAGLATILAPCIWPILPIVLGVSTGQSRFKPIGITLGLILSFTFFTLFLSVLVRQFNFDPNIFRFFSALVIGLFGLSLLIPKLSEILEGGISLLTNRFGQKGSSGKGFVSGFLTGLSLGIIWSPCAGPILASIVALSALGKVSGELFIITLTYAIGAGIPLFIISYGGQKILSRTKILSKYTGTIQKIFGVIMILLSIAIYKNWDTTISAALLNKFPSLNIASNSFENIPSVTNQLSNLTGNNGNPKAPDFVGVTNWLNTDKPLTMSYLKGKVVLVDFWTYTCINCIRTLPFVTSWYDKYKDSGFVVIGVHTPEFEFEKNTSNVKEAINRFNIHYPVAQDNNYATWNAFSNQYWPAEYLIDAQGKIRETHFGEGNYIETEKNIQNLLKENGTKVSGSLINLADQTPSQQQSPETYLGSAKSQYYYPSQGMINGTRQFSLSQNIPQDSFDLGGNWTISNDSVTSEDAAVLEYNFLADKVFLVLGPPNGTGGKVKVFLDGRVVDSTNQGSDVQNGIVVVNSQRLYNLIDLRGIRGNHTLRLEFQTPGISAYAFTFG